MNMSRDVVVLSAVRSAIGAFNGSLSSFEPSELGGIVMKEAVARSGVDPALVTLFQQIVVMPMLHASLPFKLVFQWNRWRWL
jgi:acetyl-CoA acetyltransferase